MSFGFFSIAATDKSIFLDEKKLAVLQTQGDLAGLRDEIDQLYKQGESLAQENARPEEFQELLMRINEKKSQLEKFENDWKVRFSYKLAPKKEEFALFDQEETTIGQLISEYGSKDYLYVLPQEVSSIKISMQSAIAIPRESWQEMIDLILQYNGVGVIQLNPFARQLFLLKQDLITCNRITYKKEQLALVPPSARVMHLFEAPVENVKNTFFFSHFILFKVD